MLMNHIDFEVEIYFQYEIEGAYKLFCKHEAKPDRKVMQKKT